MSGKIQSKQTNSLGVAGKTVSAPYSMTKAPDAPEGGLIIDLIGGNCPVQAEGTVDGFAFYFRARGDSWQFHVAPDDTLIFSDQEVFYLEEPYGEGPFDAGWMEVHEAEAFIRKAASAFRAAIARATGAA